MHRLTIAAVIALLAAGAAQAQTASWVAGAARLAPAGYVAGQAIRTDPAAMLGYLAVYPRGSDDARSPGSVFAPRQVLVVRLAQDGGQMRAVSAALKPRERATPGDRATTLTDPDGVEEEYQRLHDELAAGRGKLPAGTEPCDLGAWSADRDPNGLNVRAEPSLKARILGTLPPPYRLKSGGGENTPEGGWLTEFRIIGYQAGWFLIEGASPPGKDYEDAKVYPRNAPKPYVGRGWVAANKVGANFANGGTRAGGLFQSPHADAKWTPVKDRHGNPISADGGPQRLIACSGMWGLVEACGVVGWWRGLCSNQVTNCS